MSRFEEFDKLYRECPNCHGKGYVVYVKACSYCRGAGCDRCNWRGEEIGEVSCSKCDGTGYIKR